MGVARRKRELQEVRRLERTKRKQRFAEKKMRITRQVVLARVGKFDFGPSSVEERKDKKLRYQAVVYLRRKRNNVYLTLTDLKGAVVTTSASGFLGFRSYARTFPNAAQASTKRIGFFLKTARIFRIALILKSKVSAVIYSVIRGFTSSGIRVVRLMDRIPVAHNGVKSKKVRRK